jgi:hypothetical protein
VVFRTQNIAAAINYAKSHKAASIELGDIAEQAEELIAAGRVTVNGRPAALGEGADPETDTVRIDGKPLPQVQKLVDYITKKAEEEIDKEVEKEGTKKSKLVEAGGVAAGSAESMKEKLSLTQSEIDTRNAQTMDYSFSAKLGRTVSNTLKNIIDSNAVTKSAFATMSAVSTAVTKWLGYSVEPLEAVRFKTYGLTEMDRSKVVGLRRLEEFVSTTVTFGADGKAAWNGSVDNVMSEMRYDFEVSDRSSTLAQEFAKWFSARFLPTYLNYRTFLKQSTGQDKQSSAEKLLKPNDKYEVATKVAATDVWNILFSPWEKFKLSTDVAICKPNVVLLKDSVKETTLNDPGSKTGVKSSTTPTTSPTTSSLTPGSKATEEVAKKDPNYIKTGSGISLNAPTPPDAEPKPQRSGSSSLAPTIYWLSAPKCHVMDNLWIKLDLIIYLKRS